jgi:hypothetical protein
MGCELGVWCTGQRGPGSPPDTLRVGGPGGRVGAVGAHRLYRGVGDGGCALGARSVHTWCAPLLDKGENMGFSTSSYVGLVDTDALGDE